MKSKIALSPIIILSLILFSGTVLLSCDEGIQGSGNSVKEIREVKPFSKIIVSGAFKVILTQSNVEKLEIEGDDNLIRYVETNVFGNTLEIGTRERINNYSKLIARISFKDLSSIELSGACELENIDTLRLQELAIEGSGASEYDLKLILDKLTLDLSGASEIDLVGSAKKMIADLSGASNLTSDDFEVETANLDISGAGSARVFVTVELNAGVSGAASVRYKGSPKLYTDISGAGSVSPL